jgi:hypothetical protein
MSRLDYSPLGRKLEALDAGFQAYCGFIHIEAVHRNPIMLVFASYLYGRMKAKQYASRNLRVMNNIEIETSKDYSSKAIRKWHLAIFLVRNPTFAFLRKNALAEIEKKQMKSVIEMKKRQSYFEQTFPRPSLVSETDLQNI